MKKIFCITLSFIFFLPTLVFGFTEYSLGGNIAVDVSPKNPAPGQTVSLRLISYENDLNSSNIRWTINDEVVDEASGEHLYSLLWVLLAKLKR